MDLKLYKRPLACLTITGENVRITPGLLAKFSTTLAEQLINVYNISVGEYSLSFYLDEADSEKAHRALYDMVVSSSSFNSLTMKKNIGMMSVSSSEFINTPGLITRLTRPLSDKNINIVAISSSFDSILFFVEWEDTRKAYETLHIAIVKGLF